MKILLLGKNGQVGWELQRSLSMLGELTALDRSHMAGNLCNIEHVTSGIRALRPDVIVNAAAYTAVDKAESEPDMARLINAEAPAHIAQTASEIGSLFVHYSTDYVFDGGGSIPWKETDPTGPLSVYGQTKLEGEQAIATSGCRHLIFRTSWVYGIRGANFARTILRLLQEREVLTIINDQFGVPTSAELIADISALAIRDTCADNHLCGTYHLAPAGETTWWDYASYIAEAAQKIAPEYPWVTREIKPIFTKNYPTVAQRPLNSRLNADKLVTAFNLCKPDWKNGVERFLAEALTA